MHQALVASATAVALISSQFCISPRAAADDVAAFYANKTIDVIIGSTPGGGYDVYSRLLIRHIARHIPGTPSIIPKNMPGGSSRIAATHIFKFAPKDGTVLGVINQELVLSQVFGEAVNYDTAKFGWIGSPDFDVRVVTTWHTSGVRTIEDAKTKEVTMGATGPKEASGYPEILNTIKGTRFRTVRGYEGGTAINLAMERGEVDGKGDNVWSSWVADKADWIRDGKIYILLQVGLIKDPDLPNVPLLLDLGRDEEEREALKLLSTSSSMGHPVIAPPGIPAERLAMLRRAFDAAVKDPAFLEDAKAQGRPIRPVSGVTLERMVMDTFASPPKVIERAKALMR
jgi:tripartite-type tricarboxylate transporter receptor subunit TctC